MNNTHPHTIPIKDVSSNSLPFNNLSENEYHNAIHGFQYNSSHNEMYVNLSNRLFNPLDDCLREALGRSETCCNYYTPEELNLLLEKRKPSPIKSLTVAA